MLKKFWKSLREKIKSNKEKVVKREKNQKMNSRAPMFN